MTIEFVDGTTQSFDLEIYTFTVSKSGLLYMYPRNMKEQEQEEISAFPIFNILSISGLTRSFLPLF